MDLEILTSIGGYLTSLFEESAQQYLASISCSKDLFNYLLSFLHYPYHVLQRNGNPSIINTSSDILKTHIIGYGAKVTLRNTGYTMAHVPQDPTQRNCELVFCSSSMMLAPMGISLAASRDQQKTQCKTERRRMHAIVKKNSRVSGEATE